MVERFSRDLTGNHLLRSAFSHVADLIEAIRDHVVDRRNQSPKPFIWTARAFDKHQSV